MTETVARLATRTLLGHTLTRHDDELALPQWALLGEWFGEPGTGRFVVGQRAYDNRIAEMLNSQITRA